MHMHTLAFFENLFRGPGLLILLVLGLIIFGRRLPEVGRSLGRSIVEFRKGLKEVKDEVENSTREPLPQSQARPPLTSTGQDARVSRSPVNATEPDPMP